MSMRITLKENYYCDIVQKEDYSFLHVTGARGGPLRGDTRKLAGLPTASGGEMTRGLIRLKVA